MIYKNYPFIERSIGTALLTNVEHDKKVQEFVKNFEKKQDAELIAICRNKSTYAGYAIDAARIILKERENKPPPAEQ